MIGALLATRRSLPAHDDGVPPLAWRLRGLPVCASTERELDRWLLDAPPAGPLRSPRGVIAAVQRFGRGQQGRHWSSPAGGVWLSAALPWQESPAGAASPGLAVALALTLQLEALGLPVLIKWPNDLLLEGRKLAGLLPRLRLRGDRIRWARVGVGLNGRNPVPPGATSLALVLGPARAAPRRLGALVLRALEWAVARADRPEEVRQRAERRLVLPDDLPELAGGWQPAGLSPDGGLLLERGGVQRVVRRRFSP